MSTSISVARERLNVVRAFCVLAGLLLTAAAVSGCSSSDDSTSAAGDPKPGGTLVFARAGEPATLDPNNGITDNYTLQTELQIFSQLVELRPGSDELVPGLAKSWSDSEDGLSWTFNLRKAKFSNGRPVTAADAVFSLKRVLDPKVDAVFAPTFNTFVKSVSAPDPRTVVVKLKRPYSALPTWLSFNTASVVSKVDLERMGVKEYAKNPIGSGPFKLKSWRRGSQLTLVKNPYYWRKGRPYLDEVVIKTVPNDNTRVLQVQRGQVDIADELPFSQIERLDADTRLEFIDRPLSPVYAVVLNPNSPPQGELAVRQALNYATPKAQINDVVFKGRGEIANSVAPKVKYWSEEVKPYPEDVEKAKALLAESKVPDGFNIRMEITSGDEASKQTAQILQQAWAKIGVKVQIVQVDYGTAFDHLLANNYETMLLPPSNWSEDIPSQEEHFINIAGDLGKSVLGYENAEVTELTDQLFTNDEERRKELMPRIQQALMDDPGWVPLVFTPVRAAHQKNVHGFEFALTTWWNLDSVWRAD